VWGFTDFEGVNYLIFREKVPEFPPDHSHARGKKYLNFPPDHSHAGYFLIDKKSKSLTQQGF